MMKLGNRRLRIARWIFDDLFLKRDNLRRKTGSV
jgi:hypothetical protein